MVSNYEGNGHHGFRIHNTGNTRVQIRSSGESSKPLILVFVSYEPVNWILSIPNGVVIDRAILVSFQQLMFCFWGEGGDRKTNLLFFAESYMLHR